MVESILALETNNLRTMHGVEREAWKELNWKTWGSKLSIGDPRFLKVWLLCPQPNPPSHDNNQLTVIHQVPSFDSFQLRLWGVEQQPGMLYTSICAMQPGSLLMNTWWHHVYLEAWRFGKSYRKRLHLGRLILVFPWRIGVSFSFWVRCVLVLGDSMYPQACTWHPSGTTSSPSAPFELFEDQRCGRTCTLMRREETHMPSGNFQVQEHLLVATARTKQLFKSRNLSP